MRIFGNINKVTEQDDGTLLVEGVASSAKQDSQKETVTAEAMKAAIPEYMKFANVREMHDSKKAAGVATELDVDADGLAIMTALVVDPIAITKVKAGVYKGFSIGGRVTSRDKLDKSIITGIELSEISLVDRPANPDAVFSCYKADGVDPDAEEVPAEEPAPGEPAGDEITLAAEGEPIGEAPAPDALPEVVADPVIKATLADGRVFALTKNDDGTYTAAPVPDAEEVAKGCYSITQLASLAEGLEYFAQSESYDTMMEGDASTIAPQARKLASQLYDLLVSLVAEEVGEAKQRLKDAGKAAEPGDLVKVAAQQSDELVKAASELAKVTDERDTLQKSLDNITNEFGALKKKYDALPAPPKGILISKVNDAGEIEQVEVPLTGKPEVDAVTLVKSAHQNPQRLM
jgi:HK97 family phage prohead protease